MNPSDRYTPAPTIGLVIILVITLLGVTPASARNVFFEDFSTTTNLYDATADWDTVAGRLQTVPFVPTELGTADTPGAARGIEVYGRLAYVADGYSGLQIIDVGDFFEPQILGTYNTPGYSYQVRVAGDLAYVADHSGGLRIIDVTDSEAPVEVGSYVPGDDALGLAVAGDMAYVGFGNTGGLHIVDISNPASPSLVSHVPAAQIGTARSAAVAGNLLYLAAGEGGLIIYDVSDPANPTDVGKLDVGDYVNGVGLRGNTVCLSVDGLGLVVCDATDPTDPLLVATFPLSGTQRDVSVTGRYAFIANDSQGIYAFDISNPYNPIPLWQHNTSGYAYASALEGDHLIIADQTAGVTIMDMADGINPAFASEVSVPGTAVAMDTEGDLLGMCLEGGTIQFVDVTDPDHPVPLGNDINFGDEVTGLDIAGDMAVVAAGASGMVIMDITLPHSPTLMGLYNAPSPVIDVAVNGRQAYAVLESGELQVLDISNPAAPHVTGTAPCAGRKGIVVTGDNCLVFGATALMLYDVSGPGDPYFMGYDYLETVGNALCVVGDIIHVATNHGLKTYSMADPTNIVHITTLAEDLVINSVAAAGTRVYCSRADGWVYVYNIFSNYFKSTIGFRYIGGSPQMALVGNSMLVGNPNTLQSYRAFQGDMIANQNWAYLGAIETDGRPALASRVVSDNTTGNYTFSFANEEFGDWQHASSDGWALADSARADLYFRLTLEYNPNEDSSIDHISMEWLTDTATIASVEDVPEDQGGWLRMQIRRSGYDFADAIEHKTTAYQVYQRIVDEALLARIVDEGSVPNSAQMSAPTKQAFGPDQLRRLDERNFVVSPVQAENKSGQRDQFPAGIWEVVGTVFATQADTYNLRIPTLADSTAADPAWTTTVVTTHTTDPSVWFVSEPDSAYSIDNIAPAAPLAVAAAYAPDGVSLNWGLAPEEDFQFHRVYRGTTPSFVPGDENLVQETASNGWTDPLSSPWSAHYLVTTVDHAGNESEPTGVLNATDVPGAGHALTLHGATPNPFNPVTQISYEIPSSGHVRLSVYDIGGRLVARLVDEQKAAGQHQITWRGLNEQGLPAASGVYLYQLDHGGQVRNGRMVLSK